MALLEINHKLAYKPSHFLKKSFGDFSTNKEKYYRALYSAFRYKYLKKRLIQNVAYIEVTRKGKYKALKYILKGRKSKKWDGKWRLLIFDVPENKSYLRQRLRENLELIGFKYLQKSVWITPYDIRKELGVIIDYLDAHSFVHFMLIDTLEDDSWLRKKFRISS